MSLAALFALNLWLVLGGHRRLWRWSMVVTRRRSRPSPAPASIAPAGQEGGAAPSRGAKLMARLLGPAWRPALAFAGLYFALTVALSIPFALARWHLAARAGLSRYTAGGWLWDLLKGNTLALLCMLLLVVGLYGLVRRFPRRWWVLLAVPTVAALLAYSAARPGNTRLYYRVEPLEIYLDGRRPDLARRLEALAASQGVRLTQIKVIHASRTTRTVNAYLDGAGPTRELVLYDTLLAEASNDELLAVLAHELAHLSLDHPAVDIALSAAGVVAFLWLLSLALRVAGRRSGLDGPADLRTLPAVFLAATVVFTLGAPVSHWRARQDERAADRLALKLTQDPESFIRLHVRIARSNQEDVSPSPVALVWWYRHPPVVERLAVAEGFRRHLAQCRTIAPRP